MKVTELERRVMLELIERKYKELKTNKLRIDENDINYYSREIVDILISLEKVTNGKVKLLSITPQSDKPIGYDESDRGIEEKLFALKKKYPDYFYINYDPLILEKRNSEQDIISITMKDGICRIIGGEKVCYMPESPRRKKILFSLDKNFTKTKYLALKSEVTTKDFMSDIEDMRRLIEKIIIRNGKKVIESKRGAGYRIAPSIKINY